LSGASPPSRVFLSALSYAMKAGEAIAVAMPGYGFCLKQ
jgi:hypothetical protein